ncbi:DinB family protein [Winogradskyella ursingii]|uniref:DinB family protein n=1 Tax=Winogradskyella ursingii TaxID=2686079 RepID=UPI001C542DAB|nr:DinB family protein [Winogradskyella ursingii]
MRQSLVKLFNRDLNKLKEELQLYKNESNLWKVEKAITNSAGNLALHLVGNLNTYIGANLGNSGYIRQRDLEFSNKNVPLSDLISLIEDCRFTVEKVLESLSNQDLKKEYHQNPFKDTMTTEYFLLHLLAHLSYHLGQINYHRRLVVS